MRAKILAAALAALSTFAAPTTAQFSVVPGTGCPGILPLQTGGSPQIGGGVSFNWNGTCVQQVALIVIGLPLPQGVPIQPPTTCDVCTAGCGPVLTQFGTSFVAFNIPNIQSLVGHEFCVQAACNRIRPVCLNLTPVTHVRIMG